MALDTANQLTRLAGPSQVANGTSTLFTVPSGHIYTVREILIVNQASSATTVKLGTNGVTDATLFLAPTLIDASGGQATFNGVLVFAATDTLQINVSQATSITITVHGLDQS